MNTPKLKNWKQLTWEKLYEASTQQERDDIIILMLQTIERREKDSLEVYKKDPALLADLTVEKLRDVAERTAETVHIWIIEKYPDIARMLYSFECLSSFSMGKEETINYNEFSDVISSLREAWETMEGGRPL